MKINELLPRLYDNNIEMQAIMKTEGIEIDDTIKLQIRTSFENNFIKTANEEGITRFEKLFNIDADPKTETLEFRRQRLWNRLQTYPKYTENYLKQKLDEIIGIGGWRYDINYNAYTLDIWILNPGKTWLKELTVILKSIMPCNILWTIHIYHITWRAVKDNTTKWRDLKDKNLTWQEVLEGAWIDG